MNLDELRKVPLFYGLDQDYLSKISNIVSEQTYGKNEPIIYENEEGHRLYLIRKGRMKVSQTNSEGKEVILSILSKGDFFGEMALLGGASRSANVVSLEKSEVLIIDYHDFKQLIEDDSGIAIYLLKEMGKRQRKSNQVIKELSLNNAEHRIVMSIIRLSEELGRIKEGEVVIKNMPLQKDIAKMAGTSRETVSRTLSKFEKEGYLKKNRRELTIFDYSKFVDTFS